MSTIPSLMDNDGNLWLVDISPAAKGIFVSGSGYDTIDKFNIDIKCNGVLFGNLALIRNIGSPASTSTKAFISGGYVNTNSTHETSQIDVFDLTASSNNGTIWGNLITARYYCGGFSNNIRGLICSGSSSGSLGNISSIEKITLSTQNSATSYGTMNGGAYDANSSSSTIGFTFGGVNPSCIEFSTIYKFVYMTDGNSSSFGNLSLSRCYAEASSNSIRSVISGGYKYQSPTGDVSSMETMIFSQQSTSIYFGDISVASRAGGSMASNLTAIISLGYNSSTTNQNTVEYVRFSTLCSSFDFGDLSVTRSGAEGLSNSHGGLYTSKIGTGMIVIVGGWTGSTAVTNMDYFYSQNISTQAAFGSLVIAVHSLAQFTSQTKGFLYGSGYTQRFDYSTKGNSETFGMVDAGGSNYTLAGSSNCIRGIAFGGYRKSNYISDICYTDLATQMTAQAFGNLSAILGYNTSISNSIKSVCCGGYNDASNNLSKMEYVNFTMKSNSSNHGTLTIARKYLSSFGSPTRAVCVGGHTGVYTSKVDYFVLSTTVGANDYGSLSVGWGEMSASSDSINGYANNGHWDTLTISNQITQTTIPTFSSFAIISSLSVSRTFGMACGDAQGSLQI